MPSGVFKPYAGVSTAILLFTKTNSGGTGPRVVLRYAGGWLLAGRQADAAAGASSDLVDILARWQDRECRGESHTRTDQSFLVSEGRDWQATTTTSPSTRYQEVVYEAGGVRRYRTLFSERLAGLEEDITTRTQSELKEMLM